MASSATFASTGMEDVDPRPRDCQSDNDLVDAVFGDVRDRGLEVRTPGETVVILPWRGGHIKIAAYAVGDDFTPRPIELWPPVVQALLKVGYTREVPLSMTPAWLIPAAESPTDPDVGVAWHARARWAERVEEVPEPAPEIRETFDEAVSVSVQHGRARYHPHKDLILTYEVRDGQATVTTVFHPDDYYDIGTDHLVVCTHCETLVEGDGHTGCECCGRPVCRWCGEPWDVDGARDVF